MRRLPAIILAALLSGGSYASAGEESRMAILGAPDASYGERASLLKEASRHDVPLLLEVLSNKVAVAGMSAPQERAFLNEVMNALRRLGDSEDGLEDAFIGLANDESRDPGVREYALQHLAPLYRESLRKTEILQTLKAFASTPPLDTAALLQLQSLKETGLPVSDDEFARLVIQSAMREERRDADRITLLALIQENRITAALPFVRQWAVQSEKRMVVLNSIKTLGALGGEDDKLLLEQVVAGRNLNYATLPVQKAVDELSRRATRERRPGL